MNDMDTTEPTICPGCGSNMKTHLVGEIEIDRCDKCGGVWLDMLEKEKLLESGDAELADSSYATKHVSATGTRTCPRDHAHLIQLSVLNQPHIKYESCKICGGSFFEAGELKDLAHPTLLERLRVMLKRL